MSEGSADRGGAHPYREQFKAGGSRALQSSWDVRRVASWAPYAVVPLVAILSKAVPAKHRVRVWVGTLVFCDLVETRTATVATHVR